MTDPTFKDVVTLFHKYTEPDANGRTVTKWQRISFESCFFGVVRSKVLNGIVLSENDTYICRIPQNEAYRSIESENGFTICPGDIIVLGKVWDEIADVSGQRASDLLSRYKGSSFTVNSFSDNTKLPFMPHYRASGV